jgi:hypothetical protein
MPMIDPNSDLLPLLGGSESAFGREVEESGMREGFLFESR